MNATTAATLAASEHLPSRLGCEVWQKETNDSTEDETGAGQRERNGNVVAREMSKAQVS